MAVIGHRTRAVFDRYNTSDDDLRQALRQTQEHLNAQPAARKVVMIGAKAATTSTKEAQVQRQPFIQCPVYRSSL